MATQTFPFGAFGSEVRAEIDVNDATWRPSRVRVINNSIFPLQATVLDGGSPVFAATAPASKTTTWNISGVQLGWDTVDGGIMLGTYSLQARGPA